MTDRSLGLASASGVRPVETASSRLVRVETV